MGANQAFDINEPKIKKEEVLVTKDKYFKPQNVAIVTDVRTTGWPAPEASGPAPCPSGEEVLPLRLGCITEGWCCDLGIKIRSSALKVVVHDYRLEIPTEGARRTSVVCAHCRKNVEVEVRSAQEVRQFRWRMVGLGVAVPMLLVAVGKLLARWWWPNDAQFVPMPFAPGITGQLYKQFALTVAVSVMFSALVALTLTPALCTLLLKPPAGARRSLHRRQPPAVDGRRFRAALPEQHQG